MSFTANAASFADTLDRGLLDLDHLTATANAPLERLKAEIAFAARLAELFPEQQAGWQALIAQAVAQVRAALSAGSTAEQAVNEAETLLKPIGEVAKNFTIHCIGHAHIDMNWMWAWPETVARTSFSRVARISIFAISGF